MIRLRGQLVCLAAEEAAAVRAHRPAHEALTRAEPGCLSFEIADTEDPLVFEVMETFRDRAAFDAHQARTRESDWFAATRSILRRFQIEGAEFLAQGTLYPDVIESVSFSGGPSVTIKSHHNVGGLPEKMGLKLVEPLRELFKDEVRALGRELGLPASFIGRHPFPGPGLAIRCPGEITAEKLDILRRADAVYIDQIRKHGLYDEIWQAFAAILPMRTVGVMGDGRTYDYALALRAVTSVDGMTADYYPFTHEFLGETATRIINEVKGINRVFYDCTSKPPGTIELE